MPKPLSQEQRYALRISRECPRTPNEIAALYMEGMADGIATTMGTSPRSCQEEADRLRREAQELRQGGRV